MEPGGSQTGELSSGYPHPEAQPSLQVNVFLITMFKSLFFKKSNG